MGDEQRELSAGAAIVAVHHCREALLSAEACCVAAFRRADGRSVLRDRLRMAVQAAEEAKAWAETVSAHANEALRATGD